MRQLLVMRTIRLTCPFLIFCILLGSASTYPADKDADPLTRLLDNLGFLQTTPIEFKAEGFHYFGTETLNSPADEGASNQISVKEFRQFGNNVYYDGVHRTGQSDTPVDKLTAGFEELASRNSAQERTLNFHLEGGLQSANGEFGNDFGVGRKVLYQKLETAPYTRGYLGFFRDNRMQYLNLFSILSGERANVVVRSSPDEQGYIVLVVQSGEFSHELKVAPHLGFNLVEWKISEASEGKVLYRAFDIRYEEISGRLLPVFGRYQYVGDNANGPYNFVSSLKDVKVGGPHDENRYTLDFPRGMTVTDNDMKLAMKVTADGKFAPLNADFEREIRIVDAANAMRTANSTQNTRPAVLDEKYPERARFVPLLLVVALVGIFSVVIARFQRRKP